jgi:hypothetical protein
MESDNSLLAAIREAIRGPGWTAGRGAAEGGMPALDGATGWLINSPPLTTDGLRGRVVAVRPKLPPDVVRSFARYREFTTLIAQNVWPKPRLDAGPGPRRRAEP